MTHLYPLEAVQTLVALIKILSGYCFSLLAAGYRYCLFIHTLSVFATFSRNHLEEARENVSLLNPGNAARQLGLSVEAGDSGNGATLQLTAQPCIMEGGYTVLSPRTNVSSISQNLSQGETSLLLNNYSRTGYAKTIVFPQSILRCTFTFAIK